MGTRHGRQWTWLLQGALEFGLGGHQWAGIQGRGGERKVVWAHCDPGQEWAAVRPRGGAGGLFSGVPEVGNINVSPDITYLPERSMHQLCFTPPVPGMHALAAEAGVRELPRAHHHTCGGDQPGGFAGVHPGVSRPTWPRRPAGRVGGRTAWWSTEGTLPVCTTQLLAESGNRGSGWPRTWMPEACRLTSEPSGMLKCLNGKNVLMIGDSECGTSLVSFNCTPPTLPGRISSPDGNQHPFQRGRCLDNLNPPTTVSNLGPP